MLLLSQQELWRGVFGIGGGFFTEYAPAAFCSSALVADSPKFVAFCPQMCQLTRNNQLQQPVMNEPAGNVQNILARLKSLAGSVLRENDLLLCE